jgi:hypothetical protein
MHVGLQHEHSLLIHCCNPGHAVQGPSGELKHPASMGHVQTPSEHTELGDVPPSVQSTQVLPFPHAICVLGHAHIASAHTECGDAPPCVQSVHVLPFPHAVCVLGHVQAPSEHTDFGVIPCCVQSLQTPLFPHAVCVLGHTHVPVSPSHVWPIAVLHVVQAPASPHAALV